MSYRILKDINNILFLELCAYVTSEKVLDIFNFLDNSKFGIFFQIDLASSFFFFT